MTVATEAEVRRIGSQFDPLSDDYLADPYPFISEARQAAPSSTVKSSTTGS
jgi:hypothetical protein